MAANVKLKIDQGTTYTCLFNIEQLTNPNLDFNISTNPYIPVNLTHYSAKMQIRETYDSSIPVISLDSTTDDILLGADGSIYITILDTLTTPIIFKGASKQLVYDLDIEKDDIITRVVQGIAELNRAVTRTN